MLLWALIAKDDENRREKKNSDILETGRQTSDADSTDQKKQNPNKAGDAKTEDAIQFKLQNPQKAWGLSALGALRSRDEGAKNSLYLQSPVTALPHSGRRLEVSFVQLLKQRISEMADSSTVEGTLMSLKIGR